jgi:hypothetical protein
MIIRKIRYIAAAIAVYILTCQFVYSEKINRKVTEFRDCMYEQNISNEQLEIEYCRLKNEIAEAGLSSIEKLAATAMLDYYRGRTCQSFDNIDTVIANYGNIHKSLIMNPNNVKSKILEAGEKIYTPALFGGNPEKGIAMMQEISASWETDREDKFNICSGIAYAYAEMAEWEEAYVWFQDALTVYPGNVFAAGMLQLASDNLRNEPPNRNKGRVSFYPGCSF